MLGSVTRNLIGRPKAPPEAPSTSSQRCPTSTPISKRLAALFSMAAISMAISEPPSANTSAVGGPHMPDTEDRAEGSSHRKTVR